MIVREYLNNPNMPFDYFNDYENTRHYLSWVRAHGQPEEVSRASFALEKLEADYHEWHRKRMAETRERTGQ